MYSNRHTLTEAYLEPCQTSTMECMRKFHGHMSVTIFAKRSIISDV